MLQQESRCEVADNSGAKIAYVIRVYGGSNPPRRADPPHSRPWVTKCSSRSRSPSRASDVKTGTKSKAVIVRTSKATRRD